MSNLLKVYKTFSDVQVEDMKDVLRKQIKMLMEKEKRYCARKKVCPMMDGSKAEAIWSLIDKSSTPYEVEVLRRCIIYNNYIPSQKVFKRLVDKFISSVFDKTPQA